MNRVSLSRVGGDPSSAKRSRRWIVVAQIGSLVLSVACQDSTSPPAKEVGVITISPALAPSGAALNKKGPGGDTAVYVTGKDGKKYRKGVGNPLRLETICTDEPPTPDDCPLMFSPGEGNTWLAAPTGVVASGTEPLWDGTTMTGSTTYTCPNFVDNPTFPAYVAEHSTNVIIEGHGRWNYAGSRGSTVLGIPMAEYSAPSGEHWSSTPDFSYYAIGGTVRGVCYTVKVRVPGLVQIHVGRMAWYDYTGTIYRRGASPGGSGSGGRGWAFSLTGTAYRNGEGEGEDWNDALDTWLSGGGCTSGWEIWVDNDQKCDAHGNTV